MFTVVYTQTRANKDHEWWHFLPEVKSWVDVFEQEMISSGVMISCTTTLSDDGLTLTREAKFESKEHIDFLYSVLPNPNYLQERIEYNIEHSHTQSSEEIIS